MPTWRPAWRYGGAAHHRPKRQRLQIGVHRDVLHGLYYGVFRVREWVSDRVFGMRNRVRNCVPAEL